MLVDLIKEADRQAQICNACRYCEGYCSVFPALHRERSFTAGDITHLANLCHNCRGCYYACQYTAPHEFDLNLPRALAEVRQATWEEHAWPAPLARAFHKSGVALMFAMVLGFAIMFAAIRALPGDGEGFYAVLSHSAMVAIFLPAFLFPLLSLGISLRQYWQSTQGGWISFPAISEALASAATMKNLQGGHGEGCNFEDEDRFTQVRRHAHHAVMYGFVMCFLSTASGTVLHYGFDMPAPYGFWSVPKLLGMPGGILMMLGTAVLAMAKRKADQNLGAPSVWGGEMSFILLLFLVAATGLALYGLGSTPIMPGLLALHLGTVLTFFVLTPFTKMAHAPYRLAALMIEAKQKDASRPPNTA